MVRGCGGEKMEAGVTGQRPRGPLARDTIVRCSRMHAHRGLAMTVCATHLLSDRRIAFEREAHSYSHRRSSQKRYT